MYCNASICIISVEEESLKQHDDKKRGSSRGSARQKLKDTLRTVNPNQLKLALLWSKRQKSHGALKGGNYDETATGAALRKMKSENEKEKILCADEFGDIVQHANVINAEDNNETVFIRSETPFKIAWSSKEQIQLLARKRRGNRKKRRNITISYNDSTGNVIVSHTIIIFQSRFTPLPSPSSSLLREREQCRDYRCALINQNPDSGTTQPRNQG